LGRQVSAGSFIHSQAINHLDQISHQFQMPDHHVRRSSPKEEAGQSFQLKSQQLGNQPETKANINYPHAVSPRGGCCVLPLIGDAFIQVVDGNTPG
jgi:hypothetical protein